MSLPRRLSLLKDAAGLALEQQPVIAPLREARKPITVTTGADRHHKTIATEAAPFELDLQFGATEEPVSDPSLLG